MKIFLYHTTAVVLWVWPTKDVTATAPSSTSVYNLQRGWTVAMWPLGKFWLLPTYMYTKNSSNWPIPGYSFFNITNTCTVEYTYTVEPFLRDHCHQTTCLERPVFLAGPIFSIQLNLSPKTTCLENHISLAFQDRFYCIQLFTSNAVCLSPISDQITYDFTR